MHTDPSASLANLFTVLADKARLRILFLLSDGERPAGELAKLTGLVPSTVSHHLRILRVHRLVATRRACRNVYYRLARPADGRGAVTIPLPAAAGLVELVPMPAPSGRVAPPSPDAPAPHREVARALGPLTPFVWTSNVPAASSAPLA